MAGVSHQGIFQKITSEFSEIYLSEAQLRRYVSQVLPFLELSGCDTVKEF